MIELDRCNKCTLPITWETLFFNEKGTCNICCNWEKKEKDIDWESRAKELVRIFEEVKSKKAAYDCMVPFSGGKDSTFTLWKVVREYGLKPLVVSFDHGFYRPKTLDNRTRTF